MEDAYTDKNILIIGNGGQARIALDIILKFKGYKNLYLFDNPKESLNPISFNNHKIKVLSDNQISQFNNEDSIFFVAIGKNEIRKRIFNDLKNKNFQSMNIISKNSIVSSNVIIGEGNLINSSVVINTNTKIGDNNILNTGALIDHDNFIGSHSHLCPGVITTGAVKIGNNTFIGSGSILEKNIKIGDNSFIFPGSIIIKDVKPKTRIIQKRSQLVKKIISS